MHMMQKAIKIGTRGSPLALAQAHETRNRLMAAHNLPHEAFEIVIISTQGDRVQDRALSEIGGKGLFTREIEDALTASQIDIAVHSLKDMPTTQPAGLVLDCFLPREDPRDAFISPTYQTIADLPQGAVVGTSSLRRVAQLLSVRPDLKTVALRGNVGTRLKKLEAGEAVATFLAMAGLNRLGLSDVQAHPIEAAQMLPAVCQGVIAIERRFDDEDTQKLLVPLHHDETAIRVACERAYLARLDGSCQTPIAGLSHVNGDQISLTGEILKPDGSARHTGVDSGPVADAARIGIRLAERLLAEAGPGFLA
ncbi:MAG: hydroxymethylbilane synthase [Deltaproteobacteria bacterium]